MRTVAVAAATVSALFDGALDCGPIGVIGGGAKGGVLGVDGMVDGVAVDAAGGVGALP